MLVLVGRGDGTFGPDPGAGSVALSLTQPPGSEPRVLLADRAKDLVTVQARVPGTTTFRPVFSDTHAAHASLLAPGEVLWVSAAKGTGKDRLLSLARTWLSLG